MEIDATLEDDGQTLVVRRRIRGPINVVWANIAESDKLSHWFGSWSGDPATGEVMVTMNAEGEPAPPVPYEIFACQPPQLLAVAAKEGFALWRVALLLAASDAGTTVELRHEKVDHDGLAQIGPGWEWYLDRLAAIVEGYEPPSLADFETVYMPRGAHYATLAGPGGAP